MVTITSRMKLLKCLRLPLAAAAVLLFAQEQPEIPRLPSGKLQMDEILKADHEKSLREVGQILKIAEELKIEMEKKESFVLSLSAIKKTEEIEKLARRIRSRMRRF